MQKLTVLVLLVVGSSVAMASVVPEIDPTSGVNAVALIVGGLMILRSRRKK
jgi:hypothetical protein